MIPLTGLGMALVLLNAAMILAFPRRWVILPLLLGTCYMTLSQGILIGSYNFFSIRLLILAGVIRVILKGERPANGLNRMDWFMLAWAAWALVSSVFHNDPASTLEGNLGLVFNVCGSYFLFRTFLVSMDDIVMLYRILALILFPVAVEMFLEQITLFNSFSILGGVAEIPAIREGSVRSQGPFAHPILAGTAGAVCLPLVTSLWRQYQKTSIVGIVACVTMILTSSSSGPFMSGLFAVGALLMWRYRHRMRLLRWMAVLGYFTLALVMKAPVYYLIARIDISGGSTGWHRARLIESAFEHLDEWWLAGTDYTRHWMPTGVSWSPNHADITNQYLKFGVVGGLPLMLLFIAILSLGFSFVGQALQRASHLPRETQFVIWALGASLAAHAATCISVSFFDQSFVFLYLTLAAISTVYSFDFDHLASDRRPDDSCNKQ